MDRSHRRHLPSYLLQNRFPIVVAQDEEVVEEGCRYCLCHVHLYVRRPLLRVNVSIEEFLQSFSLLVFLVMLPK